MEKIAAKSRSRRSGLMPDDGLAMHGDRAESVVAAAKVCVSNLLAARRGDAGGRLAVILDDFFEALAALCPERETMAARTRWSAATRAAMREIVDTLRTGKPGANGAVPVAVLARVAAEAIRWDAVDCQLPDPGLWVWLGKLFHACTSDEQRLDGESGTVAREYLRAVAYHAAALDQQTLKVGFAIARLIEPLLPHLLLVRASTPSALYFIDASHHGVPMRLACGETPKGWRFVAMAAADKLADWHNQLVQGQPVAKLGNVEPEVLRVAVVQLYRLWSVSPPVRRFRRYAMAARLNVVRGYDNVVDLLDKDKEALAAGTGDWRIVDLSRGGVGASSVTPRIKPPGTGDLVMFCPEEGTRWHLGVVRRFLHSKSHTEIGIATLSTHPMLMAVDDGQEARKLCCCDPLSQGEAIRLLAPPGVLGNEKPLFVTEKGMVFKLRQLVDVVRGKDFDLCIFQVL
ncbi:MAG: hypothetical protein LBB76_03250 [Azoarcus sp.]|nr:hypothetical protein [Azoarcus sp.]